MEIVPSTILAIGAIALLLSCGPRHGFWVFMALTPLGAAAAINLPAVGGASVGLVQLAVLVVFLLLCLTPGGPDRMTGSLRPGQPGFWVALLFVYCVFSAFAAPRLFQGATGVFSIARSANALGIVEGPLRPSTGNITQLFSLSLSVLAFFAFATLFRFTPDRATVMKAMTIATLVHVGLGWIDVVSHGAGAGWLLDWLRTANYAMLDEHRMIGLKRMVGGFPEASAFGAYSVALFAFWLAVCIKGGARPMWCALLVLSFVAVLRSTSSGAYVALAMFLMLYVGWLFAGSLRPSVPRRVLLLCLAGTVGFWCFAMLMFGAYHFSDGFQAFLDRSLLNKLESSSGIERMTWNAQALRNFFDTGLIGAGLGSVRASNWLLAALGSVGLPGTLLFAAVGLSLVRAGREVADPELRITISALKAACFALFLSDLLTAASPVPTVFLAAMAGTLTGLARGGELQLAGVRPGRSHWPLEVTA